ncbi:MAG: hypothetical protein ABJA70_14955 [Chryseolinea sp.]
MKTICRIIASMLVLTLSTVTLIGQDLSTSASNTLQNETYHNRDRIEDNFGGSNLLAGVYTSEQAGEQIQGYSHGIEYPSASNGLNMMECVGVRDAAQSTSTRVPILINPKYVSMSEVLSLSNEEAEAFFPVYYRYESELTGLDLLTTDPDKLAEHQRILKDKFFDQMYQKSGSYLASRFLAWENYYSNACTVK